MIFGRGAFEANQCPKRPSLPGSSRQSIPPQPFGSAPHDGYGQYLHSILTTIDQQPTPGSLLWSITLLGKVIVQLSIKLFPIQAKLLVPQVKLFEQRQQQQLQPQQPQQLSPNFSLLTTFALWCYEFNNVFGTLVEISLYLQPLMQQGQQQQGQQQPNQPNGQIPSTATLNHHIVLGIYRFLSQGMRSILMTPGPNEGQAPSSPRAGDMTPPTPTHSLLPTTPSNSNNNLNSHYTPWLASILTAIECQEIIAPNSAKLTQLCQLQPYLGQVLTALVKQFEKHPHLSPTLFTTQSSEATVNPYTNTAVVLIMIALQQTPLLLQSIKQSISATVPLQPPSRPQPTTTTTPPQSPSQSDTTSTESEAQSQPAPTVHDETPAAPQTEEEPSTTAVTE